MSSLGKKLLGSSGDHAQALRKRYGARPKEDFVREAWPILLDSWLSRDAESRSVVVVALQERKLGDHSTTPRGRPRQLAYLRSCRNGASLRSVVLAQLLAVGKVDAGSAGISRADRPRPTNSDAAWEDFTARLEAGLARLQVGAYFILELCPPTDPGKSSNYYVQFSRHDSGIRSEAVGNTYLSGADQLDSAAEKQLCELGWTPPDESGNWYLDEAAPADLGRLAGRATATLRVFGAPSPSFLRYDCAVHGGAAVLLPELGLERVGERETGQATPVTDLAARLKKALEADCGHELAVDDDGDIGFRRGSAVTFVSCVEDPPHVSILSPLLLDVEPTSALYARLATLNDEHLFLRFCLTGSTVIVCQEVYASPLVPEHVSIAIDVVGEASDRLDEDLQAEFGGRLYFEDSVPARRKAIMEGGYL